MDLLELKILAFGHISAQTKLTRLEKIQLLDFVKEGSALQVLTLLATGRMKTQKEVVKEDASLLKTVKGNLDIQLEDIAKDTADYWKGHAKNIGDAAGKQYQKHVAEPVNKAIDKHVTDAAKRGEGGPLPDKGSALPLAAKRKELADDALARARERAASKPKSTIDQATDTVSKAAGQASQWVQQNPGQAAATAALGVAAITAGVLAYKRFFSKAARACKDKSGAEKSSCMRSYKAQGKQAEIGVLTAKLNSCKGNPKCVNKIKARITSTKQEVQALKSKK